MTDVTEEFINDMKERLNPNVQLKLDEDILNPIPIPIWNSILFVGHKNERKELSNGVTSCLSGFYKKIIIHGEQGIGKTSLAGLVKAASRDSSLGFRVFEFDKNNYIESFDKFYFTLLDALYYGSMYSEIENKRDERDTNTAEIKERKKKREQYDKIITALGSVKPPTIKALLDLSETRDLLKPNENESPSSLQSRLLESFITDIEKCKICLIFDDWEILLNDPESKPILQEIKNIMKLKDVFSLIIMYTDTFKKLQVENDEFVIKDAFSLEVLPLIRGELKDLIRRRIGFYGTKQIKDFPEPPTASELAPFSEDAVNLIADRVNGNPLSFIRRLKEAISLANEKGLRMVTEELANIIINRNVKISSTLTTIQKQIMEFIKVKREVTIQDVTNFQGKTRIAAFATLNNLYKLKILDKKRRGKNTFYFIKETTTKLIGVQ